MADEPEGAGTSGGDVLGGSPGQGAVPQTFAQPGVWGRITGSAAGTGELAGRTAYTWLPVVETDAAGDFPDDVSDFATPSAGLPAVEINDRDTVPAGSKVRLYLSPTQTYYLFEFVSPSGCCTWGADSALAAATPTFSTTTPGALGWTFALSTGAGTRAVDPAVGAVIPAGSGRVRLRTALTAEFNGAAGSGDVTAVCVGQLVAYETGGAFLGFLTPQVPVFSGQYQQPSPNGPLMYLGDYYPQSGGGPGWAGSTPAVVKSLPDHPADVVVFWRLWVTMTGTAGTWSGTLRVYPPGSGATHAEWDHECCDPATPGAVSPPPPACVLAVAPTASPAAGTNLTGGQSVSFAANDSGGTAPVTYAWATADGQTSTSATPTFTAPTAGTDNWAATVTATDANGCTAAATLTFEIAPLATLTAGSYTAQPGVFTVLGDASGGLVSVTVDAANYDPGDEIQFTKVDASAGAFNVTPAGGQTINGAGGTHSFSVQWTGFRVRKISATGFITV